MAKAAKRGTSKASADELRERFISAYFAKNENATQAYLEANPGVTYRTAATEGHKLLKDPEIHAAIDKRRIELRAHFALDQERVYRELARVTYFNPKRLFHENGRPKAIHELDDDTAAALAAIETEASKDGVSLTRWRPFDKVSAIEKVVKILRLYDKPPPPPPDDQGEQRMLDPKETARRMAFLLRAGEEAKPPRPRLAKPKKVAAA